MRDEVEVQRHPPPERPRLGFVLFMLVLTAIFVALGVWQLARLGEKEALIARIDDRMKGAPMQLPPVAEWVGFDPEVWDYRPVTLSGTFRNDQTVRVFTSVDGSGPVSGPGYWIVAPLVRDDGGVVLVNRGFVPQALAQSFADGGPAAAGRVTITGIARASDPIGVFTPGPDTPDRIDYARNIDRIAKTLDPALTPLAPIYVDQADSGTGNLPRGGLTTVDIPNRHFEYALTWFALAVLTPSMLVVWWQARRRA